MKLVFIFPGQGSQFPGMGQELYETSSMVRGLVNSASELTGLNLPELMFHGDPDQLKSPELAQVTIYTLSTALAFQLMAQGVQPWAVAGHSLGEFSALVAAGCLGWEEGLQLVWRRGLAMARSAAGGTMASIAGLPAADVDALCAGVSATGAGRVVVANYNSPQQFVVSGDVPAVTQVVELARQRTGVLTKLLTVGGAFHSPLMVDAEQSFQAELDRIAFKPAQVIMCSSMDGQPVSDWDRYHTRLRRQITQPVRWVDTVQTLEGLGAEVFAEIGPGRVLSGLVRQTNRALSIMTVGTPETAASLVDRAKEAV